jgi:hypothetical protein
LGRDLGIFYHVELKEFAVHHDAVGPAFGEKNQSAKLRTYQREMAALTRQCDG